ncbi:hypothetical protein EC968_004792 [Mortierella alpina]|nr:hypothetical protein EC968_004792 [Mortierella alpina]
MAADSWLKDSLDSPSQRLCGDIIQQIEDFQKDTPSKMTEENKGQIKNLKTIRKRALVDLNQQRSAALTDERSRSETPITTYSCS